jgi:tetratricopeptide (TPR) repeat protein
MLPGETDEMNSNRNKPSPILYIILVLVLVLVGFSVLIYLQIGAGSKTGWSWSQQQDLAGELVDGKLYVQAVSEYQKLLDSGQLDKKKQANVNYIMGNIYLNQLKDYENAAARFIRAKLLDPNSQLKDKINKGLVICYEAMGRSLEAQKQLERSTDLNPTGTPKKGGVVVARIGEREITLNELEEQIEMLPPSAQEQFKGKEGKLKFLQGYIGSELLYDLAQRKGLDKDRKIEQEVSQFRKQMMINKALAQEIPQEFEVTESEIKLYHDAHQDEFKDQDPSQVRSRIESELKKMKQQEAYGKLLDKLNQAQKVKIFDDQL